MVKKLAIVIAAAFVLGIFFMPQISAMSAKKAFAAENVGQDWAPDTAYNAGKMNMRFWRYKAARQILEKSIATFPTAEWVGDAHYQVALCYEKSGDATTAMQWYGVFTSKYPQHAWCDQAKKRVTNIQANL